MFPGGDVPGPPSVPPGLLGQRATLVGNGLVDPRDLALDPLNLLGCVVDQLPEGPPPCMPVGG
jgi:hypothetical protein